MHARPHNSGPTDAVLPLASRLLLAHGRTLAMMSASDTLAKIMLSSTGLPSRQISSATCSPLQHHASEL